MPRLSFSTIILCYTMFALVGSGGSARADAASDRELRTRMEAQTRHEARLAGTDVDIVVEDGQVVLSGTVHLYSQKLRYEQIVWRTPGVEAVDNEIRVVPRYGLDDAEIERRIRILIKNYPQLHQAGIAVDVTHGAVRLRGTFRSPANVLFLKHQVAEIEGITHLEIDVRFAT